MKLREPVQENEKAARTWDQVGGIRGILRVSHAT